MSEHPSGGHSPSQGPGHETTDISIRGVVIFLAGLGVVLVISGLGLWWFFDQMESYARRGDQPPSPVAREEIPPPPRLQVSARADLKEFREAEEEHLQSYGWVDRKAEMVHIPIAEAIDRVGREGVPRWPAVQTQPAEGAKR
jgi:hypothetical protein